MCKDGFLLTLETRGKVNILILCFAFWSYPLSQTRLRVGGWRHDGRRPNVTNKMRQKSPSIALFFPIWRNHTEVRSKNTQHVMWYL
jgi:hypothetical protein